jgi:filamentous hemagglutinin
LSQTPFCQLFLLGVLQGLQGSSHQLDDWLCKRQRLARQDAQQLDGAVSEGAIVIRDRDNQTQDVNGLSRDVEHANQTPSPIFDKEREQNRLQEAQLTGEIGNQAADIARTEGQIRATNAGKAELAKNGITEPGEGASTKEWASYNEKLTATDSYKAVQQQWGTGSAIQQGIQAATAAVQGLAGGNLAQAASGAAAPYLAEVIKQTAPDEASRIMAHAAVAGVIAAAQGNSALSGAAGAATTAAMGEAIKNALYGNVPVNQLSEEQKQTLVALGTVAAGLAGGLTGNSAADAVAGAQAGQNETSNNMFSAGMLQQMLAQETLNSAAMAEAGKGGANEQAALALTKKVKEGLDAACRANPGCVLMAIVSAQSQQHTEGAGSKTETVPVNDDLTGGKLINPAQDESKETSFITPDQSGSNSPIITISPETQPGKNDGIFINPKPVENTGTGYISESSDKNISISAGDFFKGTTYTDKVKQQASSGDFHSFPESVDGYAEQGKISVIKGGDGVERLRLEITGSYRGKEGVFEYIREPDGAINHRLFVPKNR